MLAPLGDGEESARQQIATCQAALGPSLTALHGGRRATPVGRIGDALVEHHRHVNAQVRLDLNDPFGGQSRARPVDRRLKRDTVVVDDAPARKRHHLIATTVSQDWPPPSHEPMQATEPLDTVCPGPVRKVVSVGEYDLGSDRFEVLGSNTLDRAVGAHGHELRRLDVAVRCPQSPTASAVGAHGFSDAGLRHRLVAGRTAWGGHSDIELDHLPGEAFGFANSSGGALPVPQAPEPALSAK